MVSKPWFKTPGSLPAKRRLNERGLKRARTHRIRADPNKLNLVKFWVLASRKCSELCLYYVALLEDQSQRGKLLYLQLELS